MKPLQAALFKLTAVYLSIIVIICAFFSVGLYNLSTHQLEQSYVRQTQIIGQSRLRGLVDTPEFMRAQELQITRDKQHIRDQLIYINLVIWVVAGVISYVLARRTFHPIHEAYEAQNRFTADASHELRTPLAAMQTEIEVALRNTDLSKKEAIGLLHSNLEELSKLRTLSDELLRLARLEAEQFAKQPVQLSDVQTQAIARVLPLAEQKHILITQHGPQDVQALGDAAALTELLVILLDNAVKYSPAKTMVDISLARSAKHVTVTVRDQGIGIRSTDLPHIFERFYRADTSRSKQGQPNGYGLGLSIAQHIAQLHGGRITVGSTPRKGSAFSVTLPVV